MAINWQEMKKACLTTLNISWVYLVWILIHWSVANMYSYFCAPTSIIGILTSPWLIASPQCRAGIWILGTAAKTVETGFTLLGVWFSAKIISVLATTN